MNRFLPLLDANSKYIKDLNKLLIQKINQLSCCLKLVRFIPSTDNIPPQQVTIRNQHVFGTIVEENCVDESNPCKDIEFHQRLKIITLNIGEESYEIGFFESGYQLAISTTKHNPMIELLERYNNGNTEELIKFYPSIEYLLCLIDRMKMESPILSKLQLEVLLMLFQQLRIESDEDFKHVRMCIDEWIENNNQKEGELLFSNLENEKWKSDQLLSHTFFSLAFSDIIFITKSFLSLYVLTYFYANNNPKYYNMLLSAIYGNRLSYSLWFYSRVNYPVESFTKEILSVLDDFGITYESKLEETTFQDYPNCLLNEHEIEYSQFMDPRSACHVANKIEFNKYTFNKHLFSNYICSDYFLVQYLVRKCFSNRNAEEFFEELKQIDL